MAVSAQAQKIVRVIDPAAILDNAAATTAEIDSLGFDYAQIFIALGATDVALPVCKLQESSTSGSGFADITGTTFGTSINSDGTTSSLPPATDDNSFFVIDVDLRGRKRYLDLALTVGNGTLGAFVTAWCVLSRAKTGAATAAQRGLSQALQV